jgi:cell division protein YceG involved in septum cleavage
MCGRTPRVSSVYHNRLELKMPLKADPMKYLRAEELNGYFKSGHQKSHP